ncbi:MAG: hypothetical protein CMO55_07375 [Verrucomicrobiales bacterium]|nr:hypothetical protein [Verrucomicrobiales bacterium]
MSTTTTPDLDAPGAGLPALELFIARLMFSRKRKAGNRESFTRLFENERKAIRQLVERCPEEKRSERVLIKRIRGLEDSSRYWSVWMTLDHLRITNSAMGGAIALLGQGKVPDRKADTAAVKPSPEVGQEIEAAYEKSCDFVLSSVSGVDDLKTEMTYAHPWFGQMDAAGWNALTGFHMGIHRAQIEKILTEMGV